MGIIFFILIVGGIVWYVKVYNSPNAKAVREICKGKDSEQVKVIEYFCKEGCMTKTITDEEYLQMLRAKRDSLNLRQKALNKIGLDEDEVNEIAPAVFEGFVYKNNFAKKRANGDWVSSAYQVAWLFFSSTQIYIYRYTFHMDEDKKSESTDEFFYKDVTSFSTATETETAHGLEGKNFEVESNKFTMVVPGDKIFVSMDGVPNADDTIQAMKQKLREKKM
ncbi:hypothetical protein [Intestinibacter sp.]